MAETTVREVYLAVEEIEEYTFWHEQEHRYVTYDFPIFRVQGEFTVHGHKRKIGPVVISNPDRTTSLRQVLEHCAAAIDADESRIALGQVEDP